MARMLNFRNLISESLEKEDPRQFQKVLKNKLHEALASKIQEIRLTPETASDDELITEIHDKIMQLKASCVGLGASKFDVNLDNFSVVVPKAAAANISNWLDNSEIVESYSVDTDFTDSQGGYTDLEDQSSEWDVDCTITGKLDPSIVDFGMYSEEIDPTDTINDEAEMVLESFTARRPTNAEVTITEENGVKFRNFKCQLGYRFDPVERVCVKV